MGAFSVFNDKRSQKNKQNLPTVKDHYEKLARKTAFLRYSCLILVAIFAVYSFAFHGNDLTVDNFRYMLKFINIGSDADEIPVGSTINFDGNEGNRGLLYKGDLAVLNEGGLTVTGWDGNITLKSSFAYDHPKMTENGSYLFCYDLGGKDLKVFNSYSLVWTPETKFEYPILGVTTSRKGNFAVVSSAKGYRSAVYVYDPEFRLIYSRLFGDKYVSFAAISPDGNSFVTAAQYSENGNLTTYVSRFETDKEDPVYTEKFIGEIPLGIYYTDGGYALLTSDALHIFGGDTDKNGVLTGGDAEKAKISFAGKNLISGKIYNDKALICYGMEGLSGGTEIMIYDMSANIIKTKTFKTSLTDTAICGETLYALAPGKLTETAIYGEKDTVYDIPSSFSSLIPDGERLIIFSDNEADYFDGNEYERTSDK